MCKDCKSENINIFTSEVAIHFPGLDGLKKPILWAFPQLKVCMRCGFTEFTVAESELTVLQLGEAGTGAVLLRNGTDPRWN